MYASLSITTSDISLTPIQLQGIIWINDDLLLIATVGTNFSKIWIKIQQFYKKMIFKKLFAKWQPFCLGLSKDETDSDSSPGELQWQCPHQGHWLPRSQSSGRTECCSGQRRLKQTMEMIWYRKELFKQNLLNGKTRKSFQSCCLSATHISI